MRISRPATSTSISSLGFAISSPGVGLGRGPARTREDVVERLQRLVVELDLGRTQRRALELFERARPDDRRGHTVLAEQPGERDGGRFLTELGAERFPTLELRSGALVPRLDVLAPRGVAHTRAHAAEQPAG